MLKDISEMDRKVGNDVRESYTMKTFEKGGGLVRECCYCTIRRSVTDHKTTYYMMI